MGLFVNCDLLLLIVMCIWIQLVSIVLICGLGFSVVLLRVGFVLVFVIFWSFRWMIRMVLT